MNLRYYLQIFNVATSRPKALRILAGSPNLFESDCRTPSLMRKASVLHRYREVAQQIEFYT
jgi:hypothetical protein